MYQEFEAKPLQYRATTATSPKVSMDHDYHHHHHQNLNWTWLQPRFTRNYFRQQGHASDNHSAAQ